MAESMMLGDASELIKCDGNEFCADCGGPNSVWASCTFGVLLCETCADLHNVILGSDQDVIKAISDRVWSKKQIEAMRSLGNRQSNDRYEKHIPLCYRRPKPKDPEVLLEQFIRSKYVLKEFEEPNQCLPYVCDHKEGYLWKQGKGSRSFNKRRFVLDVMSNTLRYFNKEGAKEPKAVLLLDQLNVLIVPEKVGNPNGMQIMFEQNGFTRNIFVYTDTGEELVQWYTSLRNAKLNRLAIAYPATNVEELIPLLSTDFIKEGWLDKSGPRASDAYRRRWVTLDKRKFMYYDDPLNPFPKGEVFVGSNAKKFYVSELSDNEERGFAVHTPTRVFHFVADSVELKKEWIDVFQSVINTPVTPKEQSTAVTKKRNSVRDSVFMLLKK